MKIFYIYTGLITKGGADRVITIKANWLATHGYNVSIVTDSQMDIPPVYKLLPEVHLIDFGIDFMQQYKYGILKRSFMYFRLMRMYRKKLTKLLKEERPDIVMTTLGREMDFLTKINDGSIKIGESHIARQFTRNFHLMEERGGIYELVSKYWRHKQAVAVKRLDKLVLLTSQDETCWKMTTQKTCVIPNPITIEYAERSSLDMKRVIAVGRLNEQKGYDFLIEAWSIVAKKHPDWTLDIYGEGQLMDFIQNMIIQYGLKASINLKGVVKDINREYAKSSILVLSSRYEGFGLVLVEAMSCGVPCVAFDCPFGPRDIINSGIDGLLVKYLDVKALADGLCTLIENVKLRKAMGNKAFEHIKRYDVDRVMQMWIDLFNKLKLGKG
ncbi:MAG: glycosyltransferase family 4 protein [Agathobacter sp.]